MDIMKSPLRTALTVVIFGAATAGPLYAQNMRFQGQDRNRDGVITRSEWRGNDTSFRNEDWNGDGVLSGEEVRPGAKKPTFIWPGVTDLNRDGVINQQDALISQRFAAYDRDGNGRVTEAEWRATNADAALFYRLDTNRDRNLTLDEYATTNAVADAQGGPRLFFTNIDRNRDGWITRNEWNLGDRDFTRLDVNRDNRISQYEFQSYANTNANTVAQPNSRFMAADSNRDGLITWNEWRGTEGEYVRLDVNGDARINPAEFDANPTGPNRFATLDVNHDGWMTRNEWQWSDGSFYRMDTNSDNRLSRMEFQAGLANTVNRITDQNVNDNRWNNGDGRNGDGGYNNRNGDGGYNNQGTQVGPWNNGQTTQPARSRAAQTGYDRGLGEGRQAGREDYVNGHGWDLDGQTQLERADSGYYSQLGTLGDYQSGYREGFRIGYREGFAQR
jgi:Ca2+-binding EF-hand superfamily protein